MPKIKSGNLIDKKYIGMVSSLNKSMVYHMSPPANPNQDLMKWSEELYNYINGYLIRLVIIKSIRIILHILIKTNIF